MSVPQLLAKSTVEGCLKTSGKIRLTMNTDVKIMSHLDLYHVYPIACRLIG